MQVDGRALVLSRLSVQSRFTPFVNLVAGAVTTLAFAPFNQFWLVLITLGVLFYTCFRAEPRKTFLNAWMFGLGLQLTGVCWIFNSLHYHGGSPVWLAVIIIFLLSAYLAIYPAIAMYVASRFFNSTATIKLVVLYPLLLALFEWMQGIVLTGFSWMQIGYTQIDTPLAGFAPLIGNHGVGVLVAAIAGAIVALAVGELSWKKTLTFVVLTAITGLISKQVEWTEPTGDSIRVALVQGNIPQDIKWRREIRQQTLEMYRDITLQQQDVDLIVWPETAVPDYMHRVPTYLNELRVAMRETNTELLLGIFIRDPNNGRYYNGLLNINGDVYLKRHLVPLGEYIPLRFLIGFFNRWINIPMSDIKSGDTHQDLLQVAGQPIAASICFEDVFARDVLRDLPQATVLVNVSNDAWFEDSHEPHQHHVIARMRALETGRYMLRATNTGISSVIAPDGTAVATAPQFERQVLKATISPMRGVTPYIIWGDYFVILLSVLIPGGILLRNRQGK